MKNLGECPNHKGKYYYSLDFKGIVISQNNQLPSIL